MLVAGHKTAPVPSDDFYLPIHVGHALNPIDLGYQPDDTGDNISVLNRSYCELTAVYWAWRNLSADGVGLSHYRRYFSGLAQGPHGKRILSAQEAEALLDQYDVVVSRPRNYVIETIDSHYRHGHHGEDLDVLRSILETGDRKYVRAYEQVFGGRKLSLYNMFLMRREAFDAYASWLFPVLSAVYRAIDESSRSAYQQRTVGYLAERLLNVWTRSHTSDMLIGTRTVVHTEGEPKLRKAIALARRKIGGRDTR